ncbi:hypothetical protein MMC22_006720 [Lobaria immixta]|nr:hypothetical protein [Lobaria immixta]
MSGFEIAGLILGSYPLLMTALAVYNGITSGKGAQRLARRLKTEEAIFVNSIHRLLESPTISGAEKARLTDPAGPDLNLWRNRNLQEKLEDRLGSDIASVVVDILREIHELLLWLRNELKSREQGLDILRRFRASLRNVKHCLPHSSFQERLDSLKNYNVDLDRLLADRSYISIPNYRKATAPLKKYLRRDCSCAIDIYNAIYDGYRCDCDAPHFAKFGLPRISENFGRDNSDLGIGEQFELVFSVDVSGLDDSFSTSTLVSESTADDATTSMTRRVSISEYNNDSSDEGYKPIQELCNLLKTIDPDKEDAITRLGILKLREKQYELQTPICTQGIASCQDMVCLEHHLAGPRSTLSRKERIDLALRLSYAILQFYSTPWIEACWTWGDFCIDKQNDSQLFVTRKFYSRSREPTTETGNSPTSEVLAIFGEPILIKLGFALIELAIGKRLVELRPDNQTKNMDPEMLDFVTAKELVASGHIMREEGRAYQGVVNACLFHQFICRSQLERIDSSRPTFQEDVEQCIIEPLHTMWTTSWGNSEYA